MPLVYYVSDLEKNGTLDAERLLRLLGLSGKLSGFYYTVYMLEQVHECKFRPNGVAIPK